MAASFETFWAETRSLKRNESQFSHQSTELDWDALRVALTRLDHSPQNFKASVGRSGALSNRRPPSRSSRASSKASRRSSAESLNHCTEELALQLDEDVVVPKVFNIEIQLEGSDPGRVLSSSSSSSVILKRPSSPKAPFACSSFVVNKNNSSDIVDLKKRTAGSYHSLLDKKAANFSRYSSCSTPLLNGADSYSIKAFEIVNNIKNRFQQPNLADTPSHSLFSNNQQSDDVPFQVAPKEKYDNAESSSSTEVVISDKESIADSGVVNRRTVIRISEKSKSATSLDKERSTSDWSRGILERRSLRLPKDSPDVHIVPIKFSPEITAGINVSIKNPQEDWQRQRKESTSRMFVRQSDSENRPTRASAFNVRRTIEKRQIQQERRERKALRQKIREELRSLSESRNRSESSCSSVSSTYLSDSSLRSKSLSSLDQDSEDYRNDSSLCKVQSSPTLESEKENIRTYLFGSNLTDGSSVQSSSLVSRIMSPASLSTNDIKVEVQGSNFKSLEHASPSYSIINKENWDFQSSQQSLSSFQPSRFSQSSSKVSNSSIFGDPLSPDSKEILQETDEQKVLRNSNSVHSLQFETENFENSPIPPPRRRSRTSKSIGQLTVEKENRPEWLRRAKERRSLRTPKAVVEQLSERAPSVVSTQEPEWVSKARKKLEALNVCLTSTTDVVSVSSQVTESSSAWSRGGLDALEDLKEEVSKISEELAEEASERVDKDLNLLDRDRSSRMLEYRSSHGSRDPSSERQRVSFDASADQAEKTRKAVQHQQQLDIQQRDEVRFGDLKHDWGGVQKSASRTTTAGRHKETRFGEIHVKETSAEEDVREARPPSQEKAMEGKKPKEEPVREEKFSPAKSLNRPVMHFGDSPFDLFTETKVKSQSSSKFESISGPDPLTMTPDQLNQNVEEYDFPIPKGNEDTTALLNILRESLEKNELIPEIVSAENSDKPKPKSILKRKSVENVQLEVKSETPVDSPSCDPQEDKKLGTLESYKLIKQAKSNTDHAYSEDSPKSYVTERTVNVDETRSGRTFTFSFNPTQLNYLGSHSTDLDGDSEAEKKETLRSQEDEDGQKDSITFVVSTHPDDVKRKKDGSLPPNLRERDHDGFERAFHLRRSLREQAGPMESQKNSPPTISPKITDAIFKTRKEEPTRTPHKEPAKEEYSDSKKRDVYTTKSLAVKKVGVYQEKFPLSTKKETHAAKSPDNKRKYLHQRSPDIKGRDMHSNHSETKKREMRHPKSPDLKKDIYHYKPKEVFLEIIDQNKRRSSSLDKKSKGSLFEWEAMQRQRIEDEERNRINKGLSIKPVSTKIKELVKFHSGFMSIFSKDKRGEYNGTVDGTMDILFQKIPSPTPEDDDEARRITDPKDDTIKSPYIVQKALNPKKVSHGSVPNDPKALHSLRSAECKASKVDKLFPKELKSISNSLLQSNLKEEAKSGEKSLHNGIKDSLKEDIPESIKDPSKRREWVEKMLNTLAKENATTSVQEADDDGSIVNNRLSLYRRSFHEYLPRKHDKNEKQSQIIAQSSNTIESCSPSARPIRMQRDRTNPNRNHSTDLTNTDRYSHSHKNVSDTSHYKENKLNSIPESKSPLIPTGSALEGIYKEKENISPLSKKKVKQSYNYKFSRNIHHDPHQEKRPVVPPRSHKVENTTPSPYLPDKESRSDPHSTTGDAHQGYESRDKESSDERSCSPTAPSDGHSVFESSREGSPFISESFSAKFHRERSHSLRSLSSVRSTPDREGPVSLSSILEGDPSSPSSSTQRLSVSEELKEITERYKKDRADRRLSVDSSINASDSPLPHSKRSFLFGMQEDVNLKPYSSARKETGNHSAARKASERESKQRGSLGRRDNKKSSHHRKENRKPSPEGKEGRKGQEKRERSSKTSNSLTRREKTSTSSRTKPDRDNKGVKKSTKKETTLKIVKEHKHPRIEVKLVRRKSSLKKQRSGDHPSPTIASSKKEPSRESKHTTSSLKKERKKKEKESESDNYESIRYRDGIGWTKTSIRRKRLGSETSDKVLARKDSSASRSERCFKTDASKALEKWAAGTQVTGKLIKKEGQKYSHRVEEEEKEGAKYSKAVSRKVVRRGSRRLSQGGELLSETKEVSSGNPTGTPSPPPSSGGKALVPAGAPNGVSRRLRTATDGERFFTSSVHTSQGVATHKSEGVDTKTTTSKEIIGGEGWEGEREMSGRVGEKVVVERSVGAGCRPSTVVKKASSQAKVIITKTKRKNPSTPV